MNQEDFPILNTENLFTSNINLESKSCNDIPFNHDMLLEENDFFSFLERKRTDTKIFQSHSDVNDLVFDVTYNATKTKNSSSKASSYSHDNEERHINFTEEMAKPDESIFDPSYFKSTSPYQHLLKSNFDIAELNINESTADQVYKDKRLNERKTSTTSFRSMKVKSILKKPYFTRCGNPINKIIKIIENESNENKNELINNALINSEYIDLAPKTDAKLIFRSQKVSFDDKRKLSKKNCCSCKKSHCLKLYCECFKRGDYCSFCTCPDCLNKEKYESFRQESIYFLKCKNKNAFKPIKASDSNGANKEKNIKGCKCKNTSCIKNYCECHQNNLKCSEACKCESCLNQ